MSKVNENLEKNEFDESDEMDSIECDGIPKSGKYSVYQRVDITPSKIPDEKITKQYKLTTNGRYRTEKDVFDELGYNFGKKIGRGGFGVVYMVNTDDGQTFACKTIQLKHKYDRRKMLRLVKNELFILETIKHPNIIRLQNHFIINSTLYIFMEFAGEGSLYDEVKKCWFGLSQELTRQYFEQIGLALRYIHSKGIAHRDLKLDNVLLILDPKTGQKIAKLTDFGLSKIVFKKKQGLIKSSSYAGTRQYMAPEIIRLDVIDTDNVYQEDIEFDPFVADIWALGVCLYQMLTNQMPFNYTNNQTMLENQEHRRYNIPKKIKDDKHLLDLIRQLLQPDPIKRISLVGAIFHPWVKGKIK